MAVMSETLASSSTSSDHSKSSDEVESPNKQTQIPTSHGLQSPNGDAQMFPYMYPVLVPQILSQQDEEQMNRGPGLYAVPVQPFSNHVFGFQPNTLIPFTYNIPVERSSSETRAVGDEQGQAGEQPQQQHPGPQRQVIISNWSSCTNNTMAFTRNAEGSCTSPPPKESSKGGNIPPSERDANENAAAAGGQPDGQNENPPQVNDGNRADENEYGAEDEIENRRWWRIVREIQLIVFGFITSLLPGFHNNID